VLIRGAVFAGLLVAVCRTWGDPDLWGHVRFGGDILSGGMSRQDTYSFTSDIPWVNHEWLAEVVMHASWAIAGNTGLVGLKLAIVICLVGLVATSLRADSVPPVLRDLLVATALVGTWARIYVIRPQLFSLLLFAGLLWVLRSAERGQVRRLWILPAFFAVWVNMHGGWIVGVATLGLWTAFRLMPLASRHTTTEQRGRTPQIPVLYVAGAALLSLAATLANPYGFRMWSFLAETVRLERPSIGDWRPLVSSGPEVVMPWIAAAAFAAVALIRRRAPIDLCHVAIVMALAAGSIRVNRLDIFFTLSVVMLLARQIGGSVRRDPAAAGARAIRPAVAVPIIAAISGVAVATGLAYPQSPLRCVRLDGPWMPEREAGAFILRNHLSGRLLAWFDWGEYAIWHFSPQLKVSIDGRRETVYSEEFVARHTRLYFNPDTEQALLQQLQADYAWLPANLPLVRALERDGWTRVFSGRVSVVLASKNVARTDSGIVPPEACFPGP
jgi:hypothetical protein